MLLSLIHIYNITVSTYIKNNKQSKNIEIDFKNEGVYISRNVADMIKKRLQTMQIEKQNQFIIDILKPNVHSVSYTHLDVYKRQAFFCITINCSLIVSNNPFSFNHSM